GGYSRAARHSHFRRDRHRQRSRRHRRIASNARRRRAMSATFAFIGAKGGSGTTTLCAELAKAVRKNVAVVDGDLSGRRNLAVLCDAIHLLDLARTGPTLAIAQTEAATVAELAPTYEAGF